MKNQIIRFVTFGALILNLGACKKDYGPDSIGSLQDSQADIPVTVTNQDFFERVPIVVAKGAPLNLTSPVTSDSPFTITFQIPANKGTIREITRVQTGANGLSLLQTGTAEQAYNYNGAGGTKPIAGNSSNTITFTSSLKEYTAYRTRAAAIKPIGGVSNAVNAGNAAVVLPNNTFSAQAPNQLRYFFLLTLDDGTQIIPMEVRVRVAQ